MRGVCENPTGSAVLLVPALAKALRRREEPRGLVKVKRRTTRPSTTVTAASEVLDVAQEEADDVYQVECDGASKSNPGPAGAGALVRRPDGSVVCELREEFGSAANDVVEYRSFILGLKGALERGIYRVRVQGDSKLVCEQILGRWKLNQPTLAVLCNEAQRLIQNFSEFSVRHVDRLNSAADQLANEAVLLPETKFVSSCKDTRAGKVEAAVLGDTNWRQCRECQPYGDFDFAQSSELRVECKSYFLGFRPSSVVGSQWLQNIFSPNKAKRALALVARPRAWKTCCKSLPSFALPAGIDEDTLWYVQVNRTSWTVTSRCLTNMAVRLLV